MPSLTDAERLQIARRQFQLAIDIIDRKVPRPEPDESVLHRKIREMMSHHDNLCRHIEAVLMMLVVDAEIHPDHLGIDPGKWNEHCNWLRDYLDI